jgi:Na+/H+ antiporter NhaD/arsenite permease-like protein
VSVALGVGAVLLWCAILRAEGKPITRRELVYAVAFGVVLGGLHALTGGAAGIREASNRLR